MNNVVDLKANTSPESTMVDKLQYNYATKVLLVTFKNGWKYQYENVPPDVYAQVKAADSVGRAFNAQIKNKYNYHRIMSNE